MKKLLAILSLVLIMSGVTAYARNYNVPELVTPVTIDGTLSSGEWDDAVAVIVEYPDIVTAPKEGTLRDGSLEPDSPADFSTLIYLKWDGSNLYLAFEVQDDIYTADAGADEPQLCFNLLNDPAREYLTEAVVWNLPANGPINANGGLAPSASTVSGSTTAEGYVVEAAVAWSDFSSLASYSPAAGDVHGLGFALQDHDAGGSREHFLLDFGSGELTMTDPSTWNTMTLITQSQLSLGDWGYMPADFNTSGYVKLEDIAVLALEWFSCSDPENPDCSDYR